MAEAIEDSILKTIKQMLMIDTTGSAFDTDIIVHINSAFSTLHQLGIGPTNGFRITGEDELWTVFLADETQIDSVKTYVYLKVRLAFDPPATSFGITAFQEQARELEWRLNTHREEVLHPWVPPLTTSSYAPEIEL